MYTLTEQICETIVRVLTQNDAERIAVFGSYARGEAGPESDIDILVRFGRTKSLIQIVRIEDELKAALHRNVDLVTEKAVSPYLADAIRRDEVVLYENCLCPGVAPPDPRARLPWICEEGPGGAGVDGK